MEEGLDVLPDPAQAFPPLRQREGSSTARAVHTHILLDPFLLSGNANAKTHFFPCKASAQTILQNKPFLTQRLFSLWSILFFTERHCRLEIL